LPENMAEFTLKLMNVYIPEKRLNDNILEENPILGNVIAKKEIANMKTILNEKGSR